MKILFPIDAFYPSQIGGPCNTLYWHCSAIKKDDLEPKIITSTLGITTGKVSPDMWLDLKCGNVFYSTKRSKSLKLSKLISQEISKTDILHLNSLFSIFSMYSFFYQSIFHRQKQVIWSVRGEANKNALKFSSWKKKPVLFLYKKLNKNIIFHSTSTQETKSIKNIFPKNTVIEIPNLLAPAVRIKVNVNRNLLFVGRIHPIKSLDKLIKGLSLSKAFLNSQFKFFIVGKNEERFASYKEKLIELIKELELQDKVFFIGHLEGEEKERFYAESYALILPSQTENFGNVVVEALNQGTPVIASLGTPWKILNEYNAGLHVSNQPETLAASIDSLLLLNKEEYERMRLNSYKLIDENFNINSQIYKWIYIYKSILNKNKK